MGPLGAASEVIQPPGSQQVGQSGGGLPCPALDLALTLGEGGKISHLWLQGDPAAVATPSQLLGANFIWAPGPAHEEVSLSG